MPNRKNILSAIKPTDSQSENTNDSLSEKTLAALNKFSLGTNYLFSDNDDEKITRLKKILWEYVGIGVKINKDKDNEYYPLTADGRRIGPCYLYTEDYVIDCAITAFNAKNKINI